ncbi:hypothetical protein ACFWY5_53490 [Nonomuraea sp. NPDC059007]|uniref:hypothetical protein n=1 Tax=Nonomuraea sp. NPDC059007 TaxID=3346692 RepID=UPI00369B6CCB
MIGSGTACRLLAALPRAAVPLLASPAAAYTAPATATSAHGTLQLSTTSGSPGDPVTR